MINDDCVEIGKTSFFFDEVSVEVDKDDEDVTMIIQDDCLIIVGYDQLIDLRDILNKAIAFHEANYI